METYYEPELWHQNGYEYPEEQRAMNALAAIGAFVQKCEEQKNRYLKHLADIGQEQAFSDEVKADYQERVELGKGMLRYYFDKVAPKLDYNITPVKTEIAFSVPVLKPEFYETWFDHPEEAAAPLDPWMLTKLYKDDDFLAEWQLRCSSPKCEQRHVPNAPVVFAGRIDLLLKDHRGHLWILDWKTAARLATDREEFLITDNAITAYCWALFMCSIEVVGFLYHEQKKGFPQPPKQNANKRKGCWYSVSKSQDTDLETYEAFIAENDPAGYKDGSYDDFLDYLRAEGIKFYERYQIHRSPTELLNAGYYIAQEAADMCDPGLRIYPQPGRFSCTSCAFREPCIGQTRGEDYIYTLSTLFEKREHYWIREEPSTDAMPGD